MAQCKCVHTLRGHKQPVQRIAICGSRLYSTAGRDIRVWDVATFECLQVIRTQQDCGALLAMTAAPKGTVYVGGQVCLPATLAPPTGSEWLGLLPCYPAPCIKGWGLLPCIVQQVALTCCPSSEQAIAILLLCKRAATVQQRIWPMLACLIACPFNVVF